MPVKSQELPSGYTPMGEEPGTQVPPGVLAKATGKQRHQALLVEKARKAALEAQERVQVTGTHYAETHQAVAPRAPQPPNAWQKLQQAVIHFLGG